MLSQAADSQQSSVLQRGGGLGSDGCGGLIPPFRKVRSCGGGACVYRCQPCIMSAGVCVLCCHACVWGACASHGCHACVLARPGASCSFKHCMPHTCSTLTPIRPPHRLHVYPGQHHSQQTWRSRLKPRPPQASFGCFVKYQLSVEAPKSAGACWKGLSGQNAFKH